MKRIALSFLLLAGTAVAQEAIEAQCAATGTSSADGVINTYLQFATSRDASGNLRSAIAGVTGYGWTSRDIVVTGVEFRAGDAVYRPGMAPENPLFREGGFGGGGTAGTAALPVFQALISNPESVTATIVTQDQPGGAFRCRMHRAVVHYMSARMDGGYAVIYTTVARRGDGEIESVMTQAQISSIRNAAQRGLTPSRGVYPWTTSVVSGDGFEIQFGNPTDGDASVAGLPGSAMRGIDLRDAGIREAVERFLANPGSHEVRLGNVERGRLRRMERLILFPQSVGAGEASSYVEIDFTRGENGDPDAGVIYMLTDMMTAAARASVQSISLREGDASSSGPQLIELAGAGAGIPSGRWGISSVALLPENLSSLNALERLLNFPDVTHYRIDTANGVLRAALGQALETPRIVSVTTVSGAPGPFAPGSTVVIRGERLGRFPGTADLQAGTLLPKRLNGVVVEVGGRRAALLHVSATRIEAQIPEDAPTGTVSLGVHNGSTPAGVEIAVRSAASGSINDTVR